ncbi:MAG TPA: PVC-type heme-binding CxxCH protein [Planctomycetota bacterium]
MWLLLTLQLAPDEALKRMKTAEDVDVRLFAAEPMLLNPACFDVDHRGRVWVAEGVNYRRWAGPKSPDRPFFRQPHRPEGDRIVILEDRDGDGAADVSTVFYQGIDLQAPMGIAVIGDKVWIAQAPDLWTIEIKPDGSAGKKETVLTGFRGLNGDHSLHSSYVGPDGKFYHCLGDNGGDVLFPDGRRLKVDGRDAVGGVIFRTNLDLTGFELLAQNHRNQVECATDAFGDTWTTDNDHDGRQWVRFHWAMEGGDFGWYGPKGSHWRMEQPGIVPILMRVGAGSPAGICVYEGSLLPKYRGAPIHADAVGRVYGFRLTPEGAAWRVAGMDGPLTVENLSKIRQPDVLLSSTDPFFRPSDVAVAPDGSILVSDWYDSVVGGGGMDHPGSGRIYRLVPKGHAGYAVPKIHPLESPCLATRTKAILDKVPPPESKDKIVRARAAWLSDVDLLNDPDPDFRVLAIRKLKRADKPIPLLDDPHPHVRRELLLSLKDTEALTRLALQYDGQDRWYLEAVAIAFRGRELVLPKEWSRKKAHLLWVLKRPEALDVPMTPEGIEVLGEMDGLAAGEKVVEALKDPSLRAAALAALEKNVAVSWKALGERPEVVKAVEAHLPGSLKTLMALGTRPLVKWRLSAGRADPDCALFARPLDPEELAAPAETWKDARVSLEGQIDLRPQASPNVNAVVSAVAWLKCEEPLETRLLLGADEAVNVYVNGKRVWDQHVHRELTAREDVVPLRLEAGVNRILLRLDQRNGNWAFTAEIVDPGRRAVDITPMLGLRSAGGEKLSVKQLPPAAELLAMKGDAARGREVYFRSKADCARCHKLKGEGGDIGPDMSVIGTKMGKEGLLTSILRPNDAIQNEFAQWIVKTASKGLVSGILIEETPERLSLKDGEGRRIDIPVADIEARKKSEVSPMPEALVNELTRQDLADLLEFLSGLK